MELLDSLRKRQQQLKKDKWLWKTYGHVGAIINNGEKTNISVNLIILPPIFCWKNKPNGKNLRLGQSPRNR